MIDSTRPPNRVRDVICRRPTCQLVNEDQPSSSRRPPSRFRTSDGSTHSGSRGVPAHFNAEWSRHSSQLRCHTDVEKDTSHDVMFVRRREFPGDTDGAHPLRPTSIQSTTNNFPYPPPASETIVESSAHRPAHSLQLARPKPASHGAVSENSAYPGDGQPPILHDVRE